MYLFIGIHVLQMNLSCGLFCCWCGDHYGYETSDILGYDPKRTQLVYQDFTALGCPAGSFYIVVYSPFSFILFHFVSII